MRSARLVSASENPIDLTHTHTHTHTHAGQMEGDCGWYRIGAYGCYHLKVITPISPKKSNQPYISAKEPCTSATEPQLLSSQGQQPYISAKEPYISAKEPYISAEESIEAYGCYHLKAINPISPQKRPTFLKKRCAYPQKSRKFVEGVCGWCPSTPIDRCRALSRVYRTLFRKCRSHLRRCVAGVA